MMNDLAPVLVTAIVMFASYRIIELFARRKERMNIIDKMQYNVDTKNLTDQLNLPLFGAQKLSSSWPLRASLLLIGIGLGLILGFVIEMAIFPEGITYGFSNYEWEVQESIKRTIGMIYLAGIFVFGGLGLLIAYLIEQKKEKKKLG